MPDNDFEKRAKQKLDELKFNPSEDVWLNLQSRLKKDRDRRRLLVWIPLLAGLLLGAGTWYYVATNSGAAEKKSVSVLQTEKGGVPDNYDQKNSGIGSGESVAVPSPVTVPKSALGNSHLAKTGVTRPAAAPVNSLKESPSAGSLKPAENDAGEKLAGEISLTSPAGNEIQKDGEQPASKTDHAPAQAMADSAVRKKSPPAAFSRTDTATKQKTKPASKHKIQWGVEGGVGASSVSSALRQNNPLNFSAAPASGNFGYNYPTSPSDKASISLYLGLHVKKSLGRTTAIYSGLQYAYASSKISSGDAVNQPLTIYTPNYSTISLSAYYPATASSTHNYTNQYHFLEIPLGVEQRLGRKSRFFAVGGFSLDWLVASHAMQYDPWSHVYFKDDSYFNRIQFNVQGSIQYQLLQNGKYSLKAGPRIQYGLSDLLNEKSGISQHLLSGGISLVLSRN